MQNHLLGGILMSLRIMVVDDEPKIAQLMRAVATPLGHSVVPFRDYRAAAENAEAQPFDVAFVGMRLPELSGLEFSHRIRNKQRGHEGAIVMLTATEDVGTSRKAFGEGADLILTEPIQADRLGRVLAAMDSPGWKEQRPKARLPLFTEVTCSWDRSQASLHSLNISESGMLLRPSVDVAIGEAVSLKFKIAEIHASVIAGARIVRQEEEKLVAVEFVDLARENQNAIQVYVMGRTKDAKPQYSPDFRNRRILNF
jgi:CheY-like chemotaxis protein